MTKNILIIDDSRYIIDGLKFMLSKKGFTVHMAEDGQHALKVLEEIEVDIILTDLFMPNMDGFELTRAIRSNPKYAKVPIVAYTGFVDKKNLTEAREAGVTTILNKPLSTDDVLKELEKYM